MIDFLFNPNGRVSRKGYWLAYFLPYLGLSLIVEYLPELGIGAAAAAIISLLFALFYFWPSIAVPVKRFHDRSMTGWWVLGFVFLIGFPMGYAFFVTLMAPENKALVDQLAQGYEPGEEEIISAIMNAPAKAKIMAGVSAVFWLVQFVILGFLPGTRADNKYGRDPLQNGGAGFAS